MRHLTQEKPGAHPTRGIISCWKSFSFTVHAGAACVRRVGKSLARCLTIENARDT